MQRAPLLSCSSLLPSSPLSPPLPKTLRPCLSLSTKPSSRVFSKTLKPLTRLSSSLSSSSSTQSITQQPPSPPSIDSASDVVRKFYDRINVHDVDSVSDLIAENCVYEDLIFSKPFVGREAILDFFKKFTETISMDLQFVIDDISNEDSSAVGVTWHLEWRGRYFPFSKGCSFYRLVVVNGRRQIVYGRDSVEPALKPGEMALVAIGGVTRLLERFPKLADRF